MMEVEVGQKDVPKRLVEDEEIQMISLERGMSSHSSIKTLIARWKGRESLEFFSLRDEHLSAASLENFTNLRVLHLLSCQIDDISSLGKLKKLETLSLRGSDISELPEAIAELNHLKLLDVWDCHKLKRIPISLLQKLSKLEELYFNFLSFEEWWFEEIGEQVKISSSMEIQLNRDTSDENSKSRTVRVRGLSRNIVRKQYEEHLDPVVLLGLECSEIKKLPESKLPDSVELQNLTDLTVADSNSLMSLFSFPIAQSMVNLKKLKIIDCNELNQIISEALGTANGKVISSDSPCLPSLETLEINRCTKLKFVFRITAAFVAPHLKELKIVDCRLLTCLFDVEKNEVVLHHLKQVSLQGLDEFKTFCSGTFSIRLPSLETLEVSGCHPLTNAISEIIKRDQLKRLSLVKVARELYEKLFVLEVGYFLSSLEELILVELNELKVIWKDPNQIISLQNLTILKVVRCNKLKNIFSVQLARNLPQLSHLEVVECEEMEQVISKDQKASSVASRNPKYFPKLEVIRIMKCNRLKYLFPLTVSSLPKLKKLQVEEASNLIQIFEHQGEENKKNIEQEVKLPALEELSLQNLANLLAFSSVGYSFIFPSLLSLEVVQCPRWIMDFRHDWEHCHVRAKMEIVDRDSYFTYKIAKYDNKDIRVKYEPISKRYEHGQVSNQELSNNLSSE